MRDALFGLGLAAFFVFGCALDSTGWGFWIAVAGVLSSMVLMVIASE